MPWPPLPDEPRTPDPAWADDLACLHAVARGDRAAFERLYRREHTRLSRFLRRFTRRQDLIDEVVNDTLWLVWRKAGEFRGDSRPGTWITGIACRCMLKSLRQAAPQAGESGSLFEGDALEGPAGSLHDGEAERERRNWVGRGLRALPDEQRLTIELAYYLGHTCDEIASIMGCAVGTVKARLFHARVRLRNSLRDLGGLDNAAPDPAPKRRAAP